MPANQKTEANKDGASSGLAVGAGFGDGPTVEEALQYADGLPADCWADRCIIELAAEVVRLRTINRHACEEWAEDHTHLQNLCRAAGCTEHEVEGDRYGVPGIMELADLLRDKLSSPNVKGEPRGQNEN